MAPLLIPGPNNTLSVHVSQRRQGLNHLSKRVNLNPVHYLTLPLKNNWAQVAPVIDKYNFYAHTISILLSGLVALVVIDAHSWKLPRWPWANDGLDDPRPSMDHKNLHMTSDELAEEKLMKVLEEVLIQEGLKGVGSEVVKGDNVNTDEGNDHRNVEDTAEDQFMEDAVISVEDIAEKLNS
jgi:hypothetical protein